MATTTRTVGFVLYPDSTLLDFCGATQVFRFAPGFRCVWLAETLEPVLTTENVRVVPQATFSNAPRPDILFVPGGGGGVARAMENRALVDFVRAAGEAAEFAGSVCTGAFITATAGLLDGREATTYWSQLDNLRLFPHVRVAPGFPRWVIHGNRFSGGGVSSSIDLALELVHRITGAEASEQAQLVVQYAPHPPFAAGDPSEAPQALTETIRAAQHGWVAAMRQATLGVLGGDA